MSRKVDMSIIGKKFGRLEVLDFAFVRAKNSHWKCKCDCGNIKNIQLSSLIRGTTISCGCYMKEQVSNSVRKHGDHLERLYYIWQGMKRRCSFNNKKKRDNDNYFNRGIKVCDEWLNSYIVFKEWSLLNGYDNSLSIDRINNDGNYEPTNCRWTTPIVQANNRRDTVYVLYNNEYIPMTECIKITGMSRFKIKKLFKLK